LNFTVIIPLLSDFAPIQCDETTSCDLNHVTKACPLAEADMVCFDVRGDQIHDFLEFSVGHRADGLFEDFPEHVFNSSPSLGTGISSPQYGHSQTPL